MEIPGGLLARSGLLPTGLTLPARESVAWQVRHEGNLGVLRRLDPRWFPPERHSTHARVAWLHGFLERLGETGFPAPVPIRAFNGQSLTYFDDAWWELVTYLPGHAIGWNSTASLVDVGAFLARYHRAAATVTLSDQRPGAVPLDSITHCKASGELRIWLQALTHDLDRIGHNDSERLVIHGDYTTNNVLVADPGGGQAPTGVIDFTLSYLEAPLADIGFGLWRSGRPYQDALNLDASRVSDFVAGYAKESPLPQSAAQAISVYIRARGVQQAVKAQMITRPPAAMLSERVGWLAAHEHELSACIASALRPQS